MARKNCGVLICETMIGNCYNPRIPIRGRRLLHHHRTVQTLAPNSMPTSGIPSSNASAISLASLLARVSASGALGLRPRLKTSVSESPRHDHVDPKRRNIREQLKKLKVDVCKQFSTLLQQLAQIPSRTQFQSFERSWSISHM
ncbi:hypothetical protein ACFX13_034359 [Malus domestica]